MKKRIQPFDNIRSNTGWKDHGSVQIPLVEPSPEYFERLKKLTEER